jgi:serine/threonine protein kinase
VNAYNSNRTIVPETVILYYGYEMLSAVATLHQCGIIHADIKPDNFMLKDLRYNACIKLLISFLSLMKIGKLHYRIHIHCMV